VVRQFFLNPCGPDNFLNAKCVSTVSMWAVVLSSGEIYEDIYVFSSSSFYSFLFLNAGGRVAIHHMRGVAGSTPALDFYLLCEPNCVSLRLFHCTLYKQLVFGHTLMRKGSIGPSCRAIGSQIH
jgi:hypothetical protein